jgi:hypothetical protein
MAKRPANELVMPEPGRGTTYRSTAQEEAGTPAGTQPWSASAATAAASPFAPAQQRVAPAPPQHAAAQQAPIQHAAAQQAPVRQAPIRHVPAQQVPARHETAQPETGEPRHAPAREKSSVTSAIAYIAVLAGVVAGVVLACCSARGVSEGMAVTGSALLVAALARLALPAQLAGLLASRRRYIDVLAFTVLGGGLLAIGLVLPPPS